MLTSRVRYYGDDVAAVIADNEVSANQAIRAIKAEYEEYPFVLDQIEAMKDDAPQIHVHALLKGGYDKVFEAGALITGGHSILDDEPKYGLAVTGFINPNNIITNSGAKVGDILFLTKPIGIGILTTAMKADLISEEGIETAYSLMTTLNKAARDAMIKYNVHAWC